MGISGTWVPAPGKERSRNIHGELSFRRRVTLKVAHMVVRQ
jgi:hypothetical protein